MYQIDSAIKKVKMDFTQKAELESITDWQGNKDFEGENMYVQRNVQLIVHVPQDKETLQLQTHCDLPWAEDHFQERISGIPTNPGRTYKYWPYHQNLDNSNYKEEQFSHTYQERFWPRFAGVYKQEVINRVHSKGATIMTDEDEDYNSGIRFKYGDLQDVIELLINNPGTRQAYLPIWFPEDTWAANNGKRVPCTLGYYFWIKNNQLYCNYVIRSCDLLRHFRNDVYLTARLMQHIQESIQAAEYHKTNNLLGLGNLTMYIFNLHLFEKDGYAYSKKENNLIYGKNK